MDALERNGDGGQGQPPDGDLGGHLSSFASLATMLGIGFNHFWHAPTAEHGGDLLYIQGHSSPGIYARAFLEGRLTEDQLLQFPPEVDGKGLSSYPHPISDAGFLAVSDRLDGPWPADGHLSGALPKYLHARSIADTDERKVWAFCGDGEMDEPESLGAIGMAGARKAGQSGFRGQLQSAAPGWPGARQRQDHPGAGRRFPWRRLERDQGDLGRVLGPAAGARQGRDACSA